MRTIVITAGMTLGFEVVLTDAPDELIVLQLKENSRKEEGNVDYNLYVNTGDQTLMFVEQWESKEILAAHLQTEHFLKFGENIADLVAQDLIINVYEAEATEL